MKRCIIALLLGFDEIVTFQNRYSKPTAKMQKWEFLPQLTHPRKFAASRLDYDVVTVFQPDPAATEPETDQPKYEYCIAISLLEPLAEEPNAHNGAFDFVRNFLTSIPNWYEGFKIIVRHHSLRGEQEISFDHKLMQERFVPGSYTHGFQLSKTYGARQMRHIPLTPQEAQDISEEITARTQSPIRLSMLASWFNCFIPTAPAFERNRFHAGNPMRITMGGCYAGIFNENRDVLIVNFLSQLRLYFNSSFLTIIGSISWTFYDDWRAISFCDQYLDRESNSDPLRGVALETEKNFFVKIPDTARRYHTRQVTWDPTTRRMSYGLRPLKNPSGQIELQSVDPESDIYFFKTLLPNFIVVLFLKNAGANTRVPEKISAIMQNISSLIAPALTDTQFKDALKGCLAQLETQLKQVDPADKILSQFITKTIELIKYFVFFIIHSKYSDKYDALCEMFEPVSSWFFTLSLSWLNKYSKAFKALQKKLQTLPSIDEEEVDNPGTIHQDPDAFINFLKLELKGRELDAMFLNEKEFFRPLMTFISDVENQIIIPLTNEAQTVFPRPASLPTIRSEFYKMKAACQAAMS